jgi:hypothetical protein
LKKVPYATFKDVAPARSISYLGPSPTYFYIQYTCYRVKKEYERGKEGAEIEKGRELNKTTAKKAWAPSNSFPLRFLQCS